jgi:hypothetical protein
MAGASEPQAILGEDLGGLLLQDRMDAVDRHVIGQRRRTDEEGAGLGHQLDRVVGGEGAVLDTVHASPDAGADASIAVGVRGHSQPVAVGLVDDRRQLLVRVLLAAGGARERHDAARGGDLDQLGPVLDLVAHRLAHLGHTVGDPLLDALRHDARSQPLEHRRV